MKKNVFKIILWQFYNAQLFFNQAIVIQSLYSLYESYDRWMNYTSFLLVKNEN